MSHRILRSLLVLLFVFTAANLIAQNLPDVSSVKDLPSTTPPSPRYQRLQPLSIHSLPDFLNTDVSATLTARGQATPLALANVISVPNFQMRGFSSRGRTWPFTMMGAPPTGGAAISVPTHIIAVSLRLQNANLVTFTTVPVGAFQTPTLNSPNFKPANYTSGTSLQFPQRYCQFAEFFHIMKSAWRTRAWSKPGYRAHPYSERSTVYHHHAEWQKNSGANVLHQHRRRRTNGGLSAGPIL